LRQQPRRHEGADLDLAQARGVGGANPLHLLRGGQRAGDALQAIAQADLANDGPARQRGHGVQGLSPEFLIGAQFRVSLMDHKCNFGSYKFPDRNTITRCTTWT
jgi:hypothetical protein